MMSENHYFDMLNSALESPSSSSKDIYNTHLELLKDAFDKIGIYYHEIINNDYTYISLKTKNQKEVTSIDQLERFIKFDTSNGNTISY